MNRDLSIIKRNLEDKKNNDIIYKKDVLLKTFNEDPDLKDVLGQKPLCPLNKFLDETHPTPKELEERKAIQDYNQKVSRPQILNYLKLNGIQKEVSNFLMFDIRDDSIVAGNNRIKTQMIIVMCLVHEDDMETEYGIMRTDLLSYIVKDLLCWSNVLGNHLILANDYPDIIDSRYYCRTLKFVTEVPNHLRGGVNPYDRIR